MKNLLQAHRSLLVFIAVLALLPVVMPNAFYFDLAIRVALNAVVVIGMNLLIGYTGQISLGHAGFFGIGAYASAILCGRFGWPPLLSMAAGVAGTALLALLVARPILRLRGHYLAMATLGLVVILNIVIVNETSWTGGPDGTAVAPLQAGGFAVTGERAWYGLAAGFLVLVVVGTRNLVRSPAGRALQAIRGSEIAARTSGIDIARFKVRVFVGSAMLASLAGSLTAHYIGFLTPEVSSINSSIEFLTMVVVGGMASVYGSVVGALLLTLLPQLLSSFAGWQTVVYGLILVVFMIALPRGIVPTLNARLAGIRLPAVRPMVRAR